MGACGSKSAITAAQFDDAVRQVEERAGELSVFGRYHPGRRVQDDYDLGTHSLGEGASGARVLQATSCSTGVRVAVKRYQLQKWSTYCPSATTLSGEAQTMLSLDHPHVMRLLDVYMNNQEISFVMELLEGGELADRLVAQGAFSEQEAAKTARQMLLALAYIHGMDVVHRDVKPENFMYTFREASFLKLIDFGFSKHFREGEIMADSTGSLPYVAPEVLAESYSSASCDMWSFGVCVVLMLAGQLPFDLDNPRLIEKIKAGRYLIPKGASNKISAPGLDFVRRLLVVDPTARPTAAQALSHPWLASALTDSRECHQAACGDWPFSRIAKGIQIFCLAPLRLKVILRTMSLSLPPLELCALQNMFIDLVVRRDGVDIAQLRQAEMFYLHDAQKDASLAQALESQGAGYSLLYTDFLAAMLTAMEPHLQDSALRETLRRLRIGADIAEKTSFKMVMDVCECFARESPEADPSSRSRTCSVEFANTPLALSLSDRLSRTRCVSQSSSTSGQGYATPATPSL